MGAVQTAAPAMGTAPACVVLGLPRALAPGERQVVLETLHSERFIDAAPAQVHAINRTVRRHARTWAASIPAVSPSERLEAVTTSSLEALRLYSKAIEQGYRNDWRAAEQLSRQALNHDPDFASASLWLAWTLHNQRRLPAEYLPHAERARQLSSDPVAGWERQFIAGSYFWMAGEYGKAAAAYEAVLQLKPDHQYALNNLGFLYSWTGRADQAARVRLCRCSKTA